MSEYTIEFESERDFHKLYCEDPDNLGKLEELFGLRVVARGSILKVNGDVPAIEKCKELFALLQLGREQGMIVRKSDFFRFMEKVSKGRSEELRELLRNPLMLKIRKKTVVPRNLANQS